MRKYEPKGLLNIVCRTFNILSIIIQPIQKDYFRNTKSKIRRTKVEILNLS